MSLITSITVTSDHTADQTDGWRGEGAMPPSKSATVLDRQVPESVLVASVNYKWAAKYVSDFSQYSQNLTAVPYRGTGIRWLMTGLAMLPPPKPLVARTRTEIIQVSLGRANPWNVILSAFSAPTLLAG